MWILIIWTSMHWKVRRRTALVCFYKNCLQYDQIPGTTTRTDEAGSSFFQLSETRLYIVLGCIAALLVVALLQAVCTIYKTSKNRNNQKVKGETS